MEYGPAKRRAAKQLGLHPRDAEMPDNDQLEDEVRAYLALFCAESQPRELAALRSVAAAWMERLAAFRPHLTGAVWRGTATRHSDVHLELYCNDSKEAELALIDGRIDYEVSTRNGPRGRAGRRAEHRGAEPRAGAARDTSARRARLRRPARRVADRCARSRSAWRSGRTALAGRVVMKRRAWIAGCAGAVAALAGVGAAWWSSSAQTRCTGHLGSAVPEAGRRRDRAVRMARRTVADQLLGNLVSTVCRGNAVAGALPESPSGRRLADPGTCRRQGEAGAGVRDVQRHRLCYRARRQRGIGAFPIAWKQRRGLTIQHRFRPRRHCFGAKVGALNEAMLADWARLRL